MLSKKLRLTQNMRGITLIELLVVLAIIGLLAGLVGPQVLKQFEGAKGKTARIQIQDLEQGLDLFKLDVGRFPTQAEGLNALVSNPGNVKGWNGKYLKKGVPVDPWGNPYHYTMPGKHGAVDIFSYGADNAPGGEGDNADLGNWE